MSQDKRQDKPKEPPEPERGTLLPCVGEAIVKPDDVAAAAPPGKQVHRRRPLPPVPEKGAPPPSPD
jgi:hypothetical protein